MNRTQYGPDFKTLTAGVLQPCCIGLICVQIGGCVLTKSPYQDLSESPVYFELTVGKSENNNVSLTDIDTSSGESDESTTSGFQVRYKNPDTSRFKLKAGYKYSRNQYKKLESFDTETHLFSAGTEVDLRIIDAGIDFHRVISRLDGEEYLQLAQWSPHASKLFAKRVFVRAAVALAEKKYEFLPSRNADTDKLLLDTYLFLDGVNRYLQAGYSDIESNSFAPELDYTADVVRLKLVQRFNVFNRPGKLSLGWKTEERSYENITPSIGAQRSEETNRLSASLEWSFNTHIFTILELENYRSRSNLPAADFNRDTTTLTFGLRF